MQNLFNINELCQLSFCFFKNFLLFHFFLTAYWEIKCQDFSNSKLCRFQRKKVLNYFLAVRNFRFVFNHILRCGSFNFNGLHCCIGFLLLIITVIILNVEYFFNHLGVEKLIFKIVEDETYEWCDDSEDATCHGEHER